MVTLILSYPPLNEVTVAVFATVGSAIGKNKLLPVYSIANYDFWIF